MPVLSKFKLRSPEAIASIGRPRIRLDSHPNKRLTNTDTKIESFLFLFLFARFEFRYLPTDPCNQWLSMAAEIVENILNQIVFVSREMCSSDMTRRRRKRNNAESNIQFSIGIKAVIRFGFFVGQTYLANNGSPERVRGLDSSCGRLQSTTN